MNYPWKRLGSPPTARLTPAKPTPSVLSHIWPILGAMIDATEPDHALPVLPCTESESLSSGHMGDWSVLTLRTLSACHIAAWLLSWLPPGSWRWRWWKWVAFLVLVVLTEVWIRWATWAWNWMDGWLQMSSRSTSLHLGLIIKKQDERSRFCMVLQRIGIKSRDTDSSTGIVVGCDPMATMLTMKEEDLVVNAHLEVK